MQLLGLHVPEQMEGTSLIHNISAMAAIGISADSQPAGQTRLTHAESPDLTEDEEKELSDRLKNLGYLE
jgi:hypothetical protein